MKQLILFFILTGVSLASERLRLIDVLKIETDGRYLISDIIIRNIKFVTKGKYPNSLISTPVEFNYATLLDGGRYVVLDYVNGDVLGCNYRQVPALPSKDKVLGLKSKKEIELLLGAPESNRKYSFGSWGFFTIEKGELLIWNLIVFYDDNDAIESMRIGNGGVFLTLEKQKIKVKS